MGNLFGICTSNYYKAECMRLKRCLIKSMTAAPRELETRRRQ